eukprot:11651663-Ditylum_brightwellii.AAC.2
MPHLIVVVDNLEYYAGSYLNSNWCNITMDDKIIEDATFSCEKLPSCDVTCKGPHKDKLRIAAKECGCTIE